MKPISKQLKVTIDIKDPDYKLIQIKRNDALVSAEVWNKFCAELPSEFTISEHTCVIACTPDHFYSYEDIMDALRDITTRHRLSVHNVCL
jgi:hypothetical protein